MGCQPSKPTQLVPTSIEEETTHALDAMDTPSAPTPRVFHEDHRMIRQIGRGAFGSVYAACRCGTFGDPIAVKVAVMCKPGKEDIDPKRQRAIEREASTFQALPKSPYVVEFHRLYMEGSLAYIAMEMCSMSLLQALELQPILSEHSLKMCLKDMLLGLQVCHNAQIVHRDVKPDNFLASTSSSEIGVTLKLCDFGFAASIKSPESQDLSGVYGTPPYMAPEMLGLKKYGVKVDSWAFGALAYALCLGRWPYTPVEANGPSMKAAIVSGKPEPSFRQKSGCPAVSEECTALLQGLLCRDVTERITVIAALEHPWFESNPASAADTSTSFWPSVNAAKRIGAFEFKGGNNQKPTELDILMQTLQARYQQGDEVFGDSAVCGGRPSCQSEKSTMPSDGGLMTN